MEGVFGRDNQPSVAALPAVAFIEPPQILRPEYVIYIVLQGGHTPGLETPDIPVGPDVLDGGDVVEGVWVVGLASGASSASGASGWR